MTPNFIHLRLHTEYSLSDGLVTLPSLMKKAAALHMPALGMTDQGNLYAAVKFFQQALKTGIKPIIGADICLAEDDQQGLSRLTLLCQNDTGYQHLIRLISRSYLEGQNQDSLPLIHLSWLTFANTGLIALSGAQEGNIGQALLTGNTDKAKQCFAFWKTLFPDRFYIEISRIGKTNEANYLSQVIPLAAQFNLPLVATNDVRFLDADDFEAHEARVCIQESRTLQDTHRPRLYTDQQYFRSQAEMQQLFADLPDALTNTVEIAKRCNMKFQLGRPLLPKFHLPAGETSENKLIESAKIGLIERLDTLAVPPGIQRLAYEKRLEHELSVINKMGFAGYFLIVADFVRWAKNNDIPVGPGRGSGPGSLVAYALHITDLDPLALDLLFERFLNPERVSLPDFDIDFCMEGRDRVIDYVMNQHGRESVSHIITYGTMAAKAVVRDVGRVQGLSYGFVDKIAKLIPFELGITLDAALEQEPLLQERYNKEEEVRTLIDLARKLEGLTRNVGKHAGGIVIAPGKLTDYLPLYCESVHAAHPVTQFDKDDVETIGLVKFDFLGLKTLTIMHRTVQMINAEKRARNETEINLNLLPLNDPATFDLIKKCQTVAVFQLESHGMRDLARRLQPDHFEDIVALVALFRPGPLQTGMVDDFINRKHGKAKVIYPHPQLEPLLRATYGVILYQEQVMQIAQVLAGYTLGAADLLRRAMGKKKPEEMAKQREVFLQGAKARQVNVTVASHIFDLMEKFAGYAFNKPHAASYALIAYQTAWLKAHYTAPFMAAALSADMDKTEKIITLLAECRVLNLKVLPPDINQSDYHFKVMSPRELRYGLGAIKGAGQAAIENIMAARLAEGPFKHLFNFCQRVDLRKVNRRVLEACIKAGCFDALGQDRATLLASLTAALKQAEQISTAQGSGQLDLFQALHLSEEEICWITAPPLSEEQRLQGEKETLGFYLTGHPFQRYSKEAAHFTTGALAQLSASGSVTIAGMITQLRIRHTKKGEKMATFILNDNTSSLSALCFPSCFQAYQHLLKEDQVVVLEGELGIDELNQQPKLIVRELYAFEQARAKHVEHLQINLDPRQTLDATTLRTLLTPYQGGSCPILIQYQQEDGFQTDIRLGEKWKITPADTCYTALKQQFPEVGMEWVYRKE